MRKLENANGKWDQSTHDRYPQSENQCSVRGKGVLGCSGAPVKSSHQQSGISSQQEQRRPGPKAEATTDHGRRTTGAKAAVSFRIAQLKRRPAQPHTVQFRVLRQEQRPDRWRAEATQCKVDATVSSTHKELLYSMLCCFPTTLSAWSVVHHITEVQIFGHICKTYYTGQNQKPHLPWCSVRGSAAVACGPAHGADARLETRREDNSAQRPPRSRQAARVKSAAESHAPPRSTRKEPVSGPVGSSEGLLW